MDNITHSLAGWALGQTGLKRKSRKGLAALILGANMPDLDVFLGWAPWAPLATHRGWTHSLLGGVLFMPPVLAGLLWLLDRWQVRRGDTFKSGLPMRFGWLVVLSYLGTLTHPFLDWQTSYAIQLFAPFDNHWYHADTLFIVDVWIWLGLGYAVWLSRKREREGGAWRMPPAIALAGLAAYLAVNGADTAIAEQTASRTRPYARPDVMVASPPPVLFWRRNLIWRQDSGIWEGRYDPLQAAGNLVRYSGPTDDGMTDPLARQVLLTDPRLARFRRWSILPMAQVTRERCRTQIAFGDARFSIRPVGSRLGQQVVVANHC